MRCLGLIGGMSWESSALYYRLINQAVQRRLGGHHNARSVLATLDFQGLLDAAERGDWSAVAAQIGRAAASLEAAGADLILLTANTAHQVFDVLPQYTRLPLLHIGEATARALRKAGHGRVGLIGTRHVTEASFYADWIRAHAAVQVQTPSAAERQWLDSLIFGELTQGRLLPDSRTELLSLIDRMRGAGLDAVIVACTELPLLLSVQGPAPALPCFDTVALHVEMAVDAVLGHVLAGEGPAPS